MMSDILSAILYNQDLGLLGKNILEPPYSDTEEQILSILRTLDDETAWCLLDNIQFLTLERHESAFFSGVRFGTQLMSQLLEETSPL